ncbi:CaiB/BaiF CoA transferase family protein [Lampropedia aestuarii]|uniref:CaiB/BaiF CoA transferase family protein n=1 Tax=Lampropedia aestuarii TaxID=2562762 RepID=UPI002468406E|nr:CaiB/BaiF CoA-transferase family protein [Lampropedia aestuarii]MDH5857311.1 CaiB/BaiF CoA-transferase family protein [Lampropedia aestuarii]
MAGPLQGLKVVEMMGTGPVAFCGMMLADMGAEVLRICRPGTQHQATDVMGRGRSNLELDMRAPGAAEQAQAIIAAADVLIEGFRPGVMERLGLAPEPCMARNPRLVYARMSGWGQTGPLSKAAGHDINFIALSGALHGIGRSGEAPVPPLNLVGFGGGAMVLVFGIMAALYERSSSGKGQMIDAAITDGTALLSAMPYGAKAAGTLSNERGENVLDGGAHFYDTYVCADGRYVAVGAIEPQFYALLRQHCGIADDPAFDDQLDRARWPELKVRLQAVFRTKTRDEWCSLLEGSDACFSPVLDWDEAPLHPHNQARGTFYSEGGVVQPMPAPRFSRTAAGRPLAVGAVSAEKVLRGWGVAQQVVG